ncbi:MAG: SRPBCC family protein [Acidobacteria bacterium]|nr:SRPBCC family protein [Acidobacteriota bacterium]
MQRTEKIIEIYAPVTRVFDLFSDFESFPRWMSHIKEVRHTGRRYTRWTAEAPLGSSVEWEAETIAFEPDQRIAWRSVRGDVETEGEVVFQETARATTMLRVRLGYDPPAGRLGTLVARLFGTNPEEQLEEDLERFAEVAEGPRRGSRHTEVAPRRNFDDEERYRLGGRRDAAPRAYGYDDDRALHPDFDRIEARRGRDWPERDNRDYEPGGGHVDRSLPREPARRDRFDRELREALRSQQESMRRYDEERHRYKRNASEEADEQETRRSPLDERRGPADERRLYEGRMRERGATQRVEDDRHHAPPSRHAMTPREREMEEARRRFDFDYRKKAFSRGVDKLMDDDDAPSSRWRKW